MDHDREANPAAPRRKERERAIRSRTLATRILAVVVALVGAAGGRCRVLAEETGHANAVDREWRMTSLTVGTGNDLFGLPSSKFRDDNGFTASLRVAVGLSDGDREQLRINVSEQMITERGGLDRVDEGRVYASWERFLGSSGVTIGWTLGVDVIGNLGGRDIQDWMHRTLSTGRRLNGRGVNELQYRYPGHCDVLALVGGLAKIVQPLAGGWSLREGVEGLVGVGTGVFGELHPFVAIGFATRYVDLELREGAGIYETNIRSLTMRGGYVTDVLQNQPSARVTLAGPRWLGSSSVSFEWELNHGDSRQHVGEILVSKRF
jgi:hypothetical protein